MLNGRKARENVKGSKKIIITLLVIFTSLVSIIFHSSLLATEPSSTHSETAHFYGGSISDSQKINLNNQVKNSPVQPADTHPRLYGTDAQWYQTIALYEALDPNCDWQGRSGWGTIKNIKEEWDRYSLGGNGCKTGSQGIPLSLQENTTAKNYLNNTIDKWRLNSALNMVHLIRRMNYCHQTQGNCQYSKTEVAQLSIKFLSYEFSRLRNLTRNSSGYFKAWHKGYNGAFFDLGAYPSFKFWTLVLDTFWDSGLINTLDKQFVLDELENEIDSYITIYNLPKGSSSSLGRWAIHNGNNWTPVLNAAALFWTITLWHEDAYHDKTRQVLDIILESNWLHRDEILDDGAYSEGPTYLGTSMSPSIDMNRLLMTSFEQPNHAMKWAVMAEKTTRWMIENVASDGKLIDFGDTWAKDGFSNLHIMDMLYWEESVGLKAQGTVTADACILEDYFSTSYYLHAFYDIWNASANYARDFYSLTSQCQRQQTLSKSIVFPTYQLGTLRQYLPGSTATGLDVTSDNIRNKQADQTFLAGNAVDSSLPHRELDFGALIWSAFGNRLLADWGYGELASSYEYFKVKGSKGYYIASNNHTLEFSLKHISGDLDISKLFINIKLKGLSKEVKLSNYISGLDSNWTTVSIPMSDFSIDESAWLGKDNGIEFIRLKSTGFIRNGQFGIDEIKIIGAQGSDSIVWYGDSHSESLESPIFSSTPQISHPDELSITAIETSGGANNTAKWARFSATGSYSVMSIFYDEDPADFHVANYMDFLPIGANTLILPKAQDEKSARSEITNVSQFKERKGKINTLDVNGKKAIHMNGGTVYGKYLAEGNLNYFHRYLIPLNDGNYVVVDSFKAKAGKEDHIQEFWYSYKNPDTNCYNRAQDVVQKIDSDGSLLLIPRCNNLQRNEAVESYGRIKAASLNPGAFILGAPDFMKNNLFFNQFVEGNGLYLINRLQNKDMRRLARFVPENEVSEDVRVFLLQSSTSSNYANATVSQVECPQGVCFRVAVEGGDNIDLLLTKVDEQYVLPNTDLSEHASEIVDIVPTPDNNPNSVLLTPVNFSASHPERVGAPEKLFDEQQTVTQKPEHGDKLPELRLSKPIINFTRSSVLPILLAMDTNSPYGRHTYVDENAAPLSATFTFELNKLSTIHELLYYDISSSYRAGQLIISTSIDNQNWTEVHNQLTGQYRKWSSIPLKNIDAKYIRFEFPEENSAKGITEVLIYGEEKKLGEEKLITPVSVVSLHPQRLLDFTQLFNEQSNIVEKPLHLQKTPELNLSRPRVSFSNSNALPMRRAVATDSIYGRYVYVDNNNEAMVGSIVITLNELVQLNEIMFYDMSSTYRPGRIVMSSSYDQQHWTPFYDGVAHDYKKWISIPLTNINTKYIKVDFHEQNSATAMSEMLIYATPRL